MATGMTEEGRGLSPVTRAKAGLGIAASLGLGEQGIHEWALWGLLYRSGIPGGPESLDTGFRRYDGGWQENIAGPSLCPIMNSYDPMPDYSSGWTAVKTEDERKI